MNIIQLTEEEFAKDVDFALMLVEKGHTIKLRTKNNNTLLITPVAGYTDLDPRLNIPSPEEAQVDPPEVIAAYVQESLADMVQNF